MDIGSIVSELTEHEKQLKDELEQLHEQAKKLDSQLAQVRAAIKSLSTSKDRPRTSKLPRTRKPAASSYDLRKWAIQVLKKHTTLRREQLLKQITQQVVENGRAKHGLSAKLGKLLDEPIFRVDEKDMVRLEENNA